MAARLIEVTVPTAPIAVVLVLHGGAARWAGQPVSPRQLSVLRMIPVAHRIKKAGHGRLAVFRLLNTARGWDPRLTDVRWALAEIASRFGDLPVGLVGHSLGGRTALLARTEPQVQSVVALAPWVEIADSRPLISAHARRRAGGRDSRVLVVHGSADRVARIDRARLVAQALSTTAEVGFITVEEGSHSMIRHHAIFDRSAAEFMAATLLDEPPTTGPVKDVLDGDLWLQV